MNLDISTHKNITRATQWLARTIYIRCIYGIFGGKITKYTVKYGVYIRFWPTLSHTHTHLQTELPHLGGDHCGLRLGGGSCSWCGGEGLASRWLTI